MTISQKRTVITLGLFAGILAVAFLLLSLAHIGYAHADGSGGASLLDGGVRLDAGSAAPAPDPTITATDDGASVLDLFKQYGPIWGGAFLVFGLATAFLKKNESEHWIAQGKALASITSVLMLVGALLRWKFGGAALGLALTPVLVLVKLFNPLGPATKDKVRATAAVLVGMIIGVSVATQPACRPLPVPVTDLVDCLKAEGDAHWAEVLAKLTPDIGDWGKLAADVLALAPSYGLHVVECVGEELIQQYLSVKHADMASTHDAHDAAEKIRASVSAPGRSATFHTSKGNL